MAREVLGDVTIRIASAHQFVVRVAGHLQQGLVAERETAVQISVSKYPSRMLWIIVW